MSKKQERNYIDDSDYDQYDVPRPDDLYKRCKHNNIMNECGICEMDQEIINQRDQELSTQREFEDQYYEGPNL